MTVDMCPFLSDEQEAEPCPGCKLKGNKAQRVGFEDSKEECLSGIKEEIKAAKNTPKLKEILPLELYKLKRLTTSEEEQKTDVTLRKSALEILGLMQKIKPQMKRKEEALFSTYMGDVLFNVGQYEKALDRYLRASKKDPKDERVWNNIGVTLVRQGKLKEALPFYDKALALDPTFGSAYFNKGKALFKLGMKKKALGYFRKAVKYSPENKSAWNNLGVTLRQLKKFKDSIKCYDKALKIHSDYPWAWHNKGVALMELKRYKDAMECFEKALQIDPNYEPAKESKRDVMRRVI
jgi:tetratricopeptide (TPR) repeat protein